MRAAIALILECALCTLVFALNVSVPSSTIHSPQALGDALKLQQSQTLLDEAPFKYRVLFRGVVSFVAWITPGPRQPDGPHFGFYNAWVACSVMFLAAAALSLHALLRTLNFPHGLACLGTCLWLMLPPLLGAYVRPTNTREDVLAYFLLHVGLLAVLLQRPLAVILCTALGVLTRETMLVLPIAHFLFGADSRFARASSVATGAMTFFLVRAVIGFEPYAVIERGLGYSLAHPLAAVTGLGLLFGWLWVGLLAFGIERRAELLRRAFSQCAAAFWNTRSDEAIRELGPCDYKRFECLLLPVGAIVLAAHLLLGRLQETRISMLLGPWVVYATLRAFIAAVSRCGWRRCAVTAASVVALGTGVIVLLRKSGVLTHILAAIAPSLGHFASKYWIAVILIQVILGLAVASTFFVSGLGWPLSRDPRGPHGSGAPAVEAV
jgi:hypothetical protein